MQEAPTPNAVPSETKKDNLSFVHWPPFARFIRDNHLVEYIQEQIRLSREAEMPLMKLLEHMPEEQLLALSVQSHGEFLDSVANNQLRKVLNEGLQKWEKDQLEIVTREEIVTEDITLGTLIRKKASLKFLPLYTTDATEIIEIIREMDTYDAEAATASTKLHFNILKEKIQEQLYFIEKISDTTPGLTYVFDLVNNKVKYANKNYQDFFGYSLEEIAALGETFWATTIHASDIARTNEVMELVPQMSNNDQLMLENRLKNAKGKYRWMRHYFSVFKRDEHNNPVEVIGIILDIENEKRASQQLAHREEQLLEAQAIGVIGSFEWDFEDHSKTHVTPQLLKIFGMDEVAELGSFLNDVHPSDRSRVQAAIDKAVNETGIYDCEYRYEKNDTEKIIWSRGIIIYKDDKAVGMKGTIMDVTERHHMIHRLQRSEELYKQAQALSHLGNYTYDILHNKLAWTDEVYRIFGYEPQSIDISLEKFYSFVHPDDREKVQHYITESIEKGETHNFYYRILAPDSTERVIQSIGEVLVDEKGVPYKFLGTVQDVTEKQNLISQLQDSTALYQQAQAMSHVGNWTWDLATNEVIWSEELFRIYDVPFTDRKLDQELATSFRHPEDKDYVAQMINEVIATKSQKEYQYRIISNTGITKILHAITEPVLNAEGNVQKVIGTVQDVTEKQLIEQQIQANQAFIQKIADTAPSIITTYNINTGKYNFVSEGLMKLLGYEPELVLENGVSFFMERVHPEDIGPLMEQNAAVIEQANLPEKIDETIVAEFTYRVLHADGQYRWLHTYGTVFDRDTNGKIEHVLNISVDITDQIESDIALQQKNIQLQQSNSSLQDYAYVASHDLKEPLRKIATFSDRLLSSQKDRLTEDGQNYLLKILDSTRRMQTMINDLLSVSMISGNKAYERYSLESIFEEVLQVLEYKIEEKQATVTSEKLPDAYIVPSQFRQLFQNLISNSLKFAQANTKPSIHISYNYVKPHDVAHLKLEKANKYLQLTFTDNGIGFDNQYAEKIFTIFQRLHGRSEYEGTGIGLAICKKIAENHGGTIFANGAINQGATFTIIIPV